MLDRTTSLQIDDHVARPGGFSLRDLLNGLFYYRRAALIVSGAVLFLGTLIAMVLPPVFVAQARLLPLSTGVYQVQDASQPTQPNQVLDPAAVVNVELQLLDSLELHRAVVRDRLGADASPAAVNAALQKFESHLHVTKANEANVIELSFSAHDPNVAADVLHSLIAHYFQTRATVLTAGRVTYLAQQRDEAKDALDRANAAIRDFQERNGIVDIGAQVAGAVSQDDALRKDKLDTDAALAQGRRTLSSLRASTAGVPKDVELYSDNTEAARALGEMQAQLLTLTAKRADLASRFMKTSPQVVQADKQIAALNDTIRHQRASLETTRRTGRNQFFDSARDRLAATAAGVDGDAARSNLLSGQLARSGARLKQLNDVQDQLQTMKLDRDMAADNFKSLSAQVEQARVQLNQTSEAGSPSVRVIEAPTPPAKRSNPPLLLIAGSLVAGLLIAGTTVFVLGSLRDTFLTPTELERALDLPVLAAPLEGEHGGPGSAALEYARAVAAIDARGRGAGTSLLLLAPSSRMSLQHAALGLGRSIARRRAGRVVLIRFTPEADVPNRADRLALEPFDGMATGVIGTGAIGGSGMDARLIAELKTLYDHVVVTAPPIADGFEGVELVPAFDRVALVVEAAQTRAPVLRRLLEQVEEAGGTVIGTILLGRRSYIPAFLYRLLIERRWRAR